jgi:hypothetical protein
MQNRWTKAALYVGLPILIFALYLGVRVPIRALFQSMFRKDEPITQHTTPRLNIMKRFLGAIIDLGDDKKTWFVKLVGSETEIDKLEEPFLRLVRSFKFANPDAPTWTLPEGWTQDEPAEKLRYMTIFPAPKDKSPEIAVSYLPGPLDLSKNIDRWRMQIGLKGLDSFPLEQALFYRKEPLGEYQLILVDMLGPGGKEAAPPPPPKKDGQFKYKTPPGWQPGQATQFSLASFAIVEGDKRAMVTVSKAGGKLLENINRWRGQVGLEPISEAQLAKDGKEVPVGREKGVLVDLIGGPNANPNMSRIVGAVVFRVDSAWFFKMTGPTDLVGKQKDAFESFLKSVSFGE